MAAWDRHCSRISLTSRRSWILSSCRQTVRHTFGAKCNVCMDQTTHRMSVTNACAIIIISKNESCFNKVYMNCVCSWDFHRWETHIIETFLYHSNCSGLTLKEQGSMCTGCTANHNQMYRQLYAVHPIFPCCLRDDFPFREQREKIVGNVFLAGTCCTPEHPRSIKLRNSDWALFLCISKSVVDKLRFVCWRYGSLILSKKMGSLFLLWAASCCPEARVAPWKNFWICKFFLLIKKGCLLTSTNGKGPVVFNDSVL